MPCYELTAPEANQIYLDQTARDEFLVQYHGSWMCGLAEGLVRGPSSDVSGSGTGVPALRWVEFWSVFVDVQMFFVRSLCC